MLQLVAATEDREESVLAGGLSPDQQSRYVTRLPERAVFAVPAELARVLDRSPDALRSLSLFDLQAGEGILQLFSLG